MKKVYKFLRLRKKSCENVLKKHEHNKKYNNEERM